MGSDAPTQRLSVAHVSLARGYKGNERQTELLIKELAKLGVPQMLVCRDISPLPMHLEGTKGLKIMRIRGMTDPRIMGHFRLGKQYAILQAHEPHAMQWCFVHYLMFGTPYVLTLRKDKAERNNFFNRAMFNNAGSLIAISKIIKKQVEEAFSRKCHLVCDCASHLRPNIEVVRRYRQSWKNRFVVGNVGALINRQNGQSTLIDAAKILKTKLPELVIVFVGAGDDTGLLKLHADGMPNVKFAGFRRNITDYIASFDAFAYPAVVESTNSIILDVMEQGVPIIATNIGNAPDLIQSGYNGFLIKPNDAEALAQCILSLKRNPNMRRGMANNAFQMVEEHSSAAMAADYYRIYMNLLNNGKEA